MMANKYHFFTYIKISYLSFTSFESAGILMKTENFWHAAKQAKIYQTYNGKNIQ